MRILTKDENGAYYINARLANSLIISIFSFALTTLIYMINWNKDDAVWKAAQLARYDTLTRDNLMMDRRVDNLARWSDQIVTNTQHLKEVDQRLDRLERK